MWKKLLQQSCRGSHNSLYVTTENWNPCTHLQATKPSTCPLGFLVNLKSSLRAVLFVVPVMSAWTGKVSKLYSSPKNDVVHNYTTYYLTPATRLLPDVRFSAAKFTLWPLPQDLQTESVCGLPVKLTRQCTSLILEQPISYGCVRSFVRSLTAYPAI